MRSAWLRWLGAGLAAGLVMSGPAWGQRGGRGGEVPRESIEQAIQQGVERILATQRDDGALVLDERRFGVTPNPEEEHVYPVGCTALGVLALQHALPHLKGETATKTRAAIQKSLAWLQQRPPEPETYSAGLMISVLCKDDARKHQRLLGAYATMLVQGQWQKGKMAGAWAYFLPMPPGFTAPPELAKLTAKDIPDHSNTQYAVLGLLYANNAGFQVPAGTWGLLRKHYMETQFANGGWGYARNNPDESTINMTLASTISLQICEEMLFSQEHRQCKPLAENPAVTRGLKYIATSLNYQSLETYGMYATERLGILSGLSELGGRPWFDEGARQLLENRAWPSQAVNGPNQRVGAAFAVLFLSRGLEPVIINKLKRAGTEDWNNDTYDVKHLVEYISDRFQYPKQWRIVTLEADVEFLKRVPILYISGHEALSFTAEEKAKLKEYVEGGGTIFGMACCGKAPFDKSFRELVSELWPGSELTPLAKEHSIYVNPRPLGERPQLLGMAMEKGEGRLGVIYSPYDLCCRWHMGGGRAKAVFDVGANITFYVEKAARRAAAEPAGAAERRVQAPQE